MPSTPTMPLQERRGGGALPAKLAQRVCAPPDRRRSPSYAPFDGALVGEVPDCTPDDVDEAARRARAAQRAWSTRPVSERCRIALRFADLLLDRREQVLDLTQVETGKARISAFEELADLALVARYYGRAAPELLRPARRRGAVPGLTRTVEHRCPVGLVGVISPWNYPLDLAVGDALPALLAGNAVVLKPDPQTPFTALLAVELLVEAGLPAELLQVVTGGATVGSAVVDAVDFVMFTGSTATGRQVAERCGRRLIGFSAELGGKNPLLVLADADLPRTVEGAVRACFSNTGQLCISAERLYVEDAVYDAFASAFVARTQRLRVGPGLTWEAEMGSLVSERQLAVVERHVADAVSRGARVLTGGRRRPDLGPLFYEPTVLEGVTDEMVVAREETFGPVVALHRVRDADEAVERANDSSYGLNASVWSTPARGAGIATRLRAGTVNVNDGYAATWASHDAPMGGVRDSGLGRRHGREGLVKYTEAQTVAVQRVLPLGPLPGLPLDRYAQAVTAGVRLLRRLP